MSPDMTAELWASLKSVLSPADRAAALRAALAARNCAKVGILAPGSVWSMPCRKRRTQCGDLSLAYQVFGDGPIELVFAGSFASHIELYWTLPEFVAFFERLSTFCRVLLFDKAGVGLSDPVPQVRTLDDRAAEIEAVMDAVGFESAAALRC